MGGVGLSILKGLERFVGGIRPNFSTEEADMGPNGGIMRVLAFASGDEKGGGSGFQELVEFSRTKPPVLDAQIVGVISNHQKGGVSRRAEALHIPFEYW